MTEKQPRVPGMREIKPNREQRRYPEGGRPQDHPLTRDENAPEQDVPEIHAKNGGHGKRGADKRNQ